MDFERAKREVSQLKSRSDFTGSQITNVQRWLPKKKRPIRPEEEEFIKRDGDPVSVDPKLRTHPRRYIDRF
jgi:hypothetical protein